MEQRIDADLATGRHADVVAELEALIGRHPLRERLRGQLMLALYRSGRQAEALETYQAARSALIEELGIEPSRGSATSIRRSWLRIPHSRRESTVTTRRRARGRSRRVVPDPVRAPHSWDASASWPSWWERSRTRWPVGAASSWSPASPASARAG